MKNILTIICAILLISVFCACSSDSSPPRDFLNAQFKCISGAVMSSELGTVGDFVAKLEKNGSKITWKNEKKSWLLHINPNKKDKIVMNFVDWREDKMYKCVWLMEVAVGGAMLPSQQIEGLIGSIR